MNENVLFADDPQKLVGGQAQGSLKDKIAAIMANPDLTPEGKQKAITMARKANIVVRIQERAAIEQRATGLRKRAVSAALRVGLVGQVLSTLAEEEAKKMDFSRLSYEAMAVKSALVLAGNDPYKITEAFEKAKSSGDNYKIRAWLDVAPGLMPAETFAPDTLAELKEDFQNSQSLLFSAEMAKYEAEKRSNLDELAAISIEAAQDDSFFGPDNHGILERVFSGIAIDRQNEDLKVDFGVRIKTDYLGGQSLETSEETFGRLENEYKERVKLQEDLFAKFGTAYDPLADGVWSEAIGQPAGTATEGTTREVNDEPENT